MKLFCLLVFLVMVSACADKSTSNRNEQLAGMYKLHSFQVLDSAGEYHHEWASDGTGFIIYDGQG